MTPYALELIARVEARALTQPPRQPRVSIPRREAQHKWVIKGKQAVADAIERSRQVKREKWGRE